MNTLGQAPASEPSPCLARQPIFTKEERVEGYELLFRENADDNRFEADFEHATSSIIDTLNVMGLDAVCDGHLGFINCTKQMLLKEFFLLLPPDRIVIEIQQNVAADETVQGARQLQAKRSARSAGSFCRFSEGGCSPVYLGAERGVVREIRGQGDSDDCAQS